MKWISIIASAILLAACSSNKEPEKTNVEQPKPAANTLNFSNNMDGENPWTPYANYAYAVVSEDAHSGKSCMKMDPNIEFSAGFSQFLGKIGKTIPKSVEISVWVKFDVVPDSSTAIVLAIDSAGVSKKWESVSVSSPEASKKQWYQVKMNYPIPTNYTGVEKLNIYVWNPKKQTFLVDDMDVNFTF